VGHLDELQRKIQLEALALAFIGTGILGAGYGFLWDAGVAPGDWGGIHLARDGRPVGGRLRGGQPAVSMKNRLRVLRAERNWSQADLAGKLSVSRQTVNALETGKYHPSLPLAFRIARLFDRPIEEIFEP
jgi:putative transcriptional regulator